MATVGNSRNLHKSKPSEPILKNNFPATYLRMMYGFSGMHNPFLMLNFQFQVKVMSTSRWPYKLHYVLYLSVHFIKFIESFYLDLTLASDPDFSKQYQNDSANSNVFKP